MGDDNDCFVSREEYEALEAKYEALETRYEKLEGRLRTIEKWQHFVIGAVAAVFALLGIALSVFEKVVK